ncbi:MAG: hypothetical protein CBE50_001345 [Flammeovirgaceae bacterium TMED290]|nr:MAG: hypothetical protein CBE50_001345 [Flammeovirgaceae bacterium TMED290]|tara:strand:+ start:6337 stop:7659 length:1323 start_codon:yes stop_codon:yes gene_type:complete
MRYILIIFFLITARSSFSQEAVSGKFFLVGETQYKFTYFSPSDLNFKNNNVKRLVIVLHGRTRTAEQRQNAIIQAANTENTYLETLIISPHFIGSQELAAHNLDNNHLYWQDKEWMEGGLSSSSGSYPREESFSSFEVMDDIISQIIYSENFPNLAQIILTGFSGGGQFMNRYASSNRIQEKFEDENNIVFKYLVAAPSSFMYFNDERRVEGTTDQFEKPSVPNCATYNNYKYGPVNMNEYMKYYHLDTLIARYKRRDISYGAGSRDNNPNSSSLDDTCQGMLQGDHRLQRASIYVNYMTHLHGDLGENHKLTVANGVGHDSFAFYNKSNIRPLLFPEITNTPNNNQTEEDPLSIEFEAEILLYPTISSKNLYLKANALKNPKVSIFNTNGVPLNNFKISTINESLMRININKLYDGLYVLFYTDNTLNKQKRLKFIKRK